MALLAQSWEAGDRVFSVVVSPDSARVGAGCGWNVQIWDLHSDEMVLGPLRGHSNNVNSVAYSTDGRTIASGSWDNTIRVWDTATGAAAIEPLKGHTDILQSVTFSYDGRLIVSGSWDKTIRLWDARTGRLTGTPIDVGVSVYSVAVSLDSSKVLGGGYGGTMKTYDVATRTTLFQHTGHTEWVSSVAFSPDGRRIVSASADKTVRIWDTSIGSSVGDPLEGHTGSVRSVAFSPDSRYIASGSGDKTILIWDAATGAAQTNSLCSHTNWVNSVVFTPDGGALISGSLDRTIRLWDVLGTGMGGNGNVRPLSTTPSLTDEITETTTVKQMVRQLGHQGCGNLTKLLDVSTRDAHDHPLSWNYEGFFRGKLTFGMEVAIKTMILHEDASWESQKRLKLVASEIRARARCRHPNVQPLLGVASLGPGEIGIVGAWELNGDMPRYLRQYPDTDRCKMSVQIAEGLLYLHGLGVVHGNLKGTNVLISKDGSPRLADFGNAVSQQFGLKYFSHSMNVTKILSRPWAAPELFGALNQFDAARCNFASDVYALGMTILEAITGKVPFSDTKSSLSFGWVVDNQSSQIERPEASLPVGSKDGQRMWSLLRWCWELSPVKRPNVASVIGILAKITQAGLQCRETKS